MGHSLHQLLLAVQAVNKMPMPSDNVRRQRGGRRGSRFGHSQVAQIKLDELLQEAGINWQESLMLQSK